MKRIIITVVAALAASALLSGCVSAMFRSAGEDGWDRPYIGTMAWGQALAYTPDFLPPWLVDLPFEIVVDAVFLPIDIIVLLFEED